MSIAQALTNLRPGSDWIIRDGVLEWLDKEQTQPSQSEIDAEVLRLKSIYNATQYQRDRKYPDLGEQFDLLFKDINSGKVSKDGGFYKAIKAVKDTHPKPSE